jgi:hypothetical protein
MAVFAGPEIVNSGLVLHLDAANERSYPGTGATWSDVSGNGNNGTLVNGVGYSAVNKGELIFDGSNDYVELENDLLLGTNYSISLIFEQTSTRTDWVRLIGHSNDSAARFWGIWMPAARNYLLWQSYEGGGQYSTSTYSFNLDQIYQIDFTSEGASKKFYIDGNLLHTASAGGSIDYTGNTSKIRIGYAGFHTYHIGNVYSTKIYNKALSATEIQQNFEATRSRYGI